jgi:hypothetical protein
LPSTGTAPNKGVSSTPAEQSPSLSDSAASKFAQAWRERATRLNRNAESGLKWADKLGKLLGGVPIGEAAARWVGIESGGNPLNASKMGERGLAQVLKSSLPQLGLTESDFAAMASAQTTADAHAALAAKVIAGTALASARTGARGPDPGWGPPVGPSPFTGGVVTLNGIGIAKLYHGLPLFLVEMHKQGHLRVNIPLTIRSALVATDGKARYRPSVKAASYASKVVGDPAGDLLLRFLCSAAVVAKGVDAIPFGDAAIGGTK